MHEKEKKGHAVSEKTTTMLSQICTLVIGLIIFGISINPPSVIWKINMFAFGGLEVHFSGFPAWYVLEKSEQSRSCQCGLSVERYAIV